MCLLAMLAWKGHWGNTNDKLDIAISQRQRTEAVLLLTLGLCAIQAISLLASCLQFLLESGLAGAVNSARCIAQKRFHCFNVGEPETVTPVTRLALDLNRLELGFDCSAARLANNSDFPTQHLHQTDFHGSLVRSLHVR